MTVLDTNVVSEFFKPKPDAAVLRWFQPLRPVELAVTAVTVMELLHGAERMPRGRRRENLRSLFDRFFRTAVSEVLPFDLAAAEACAIYLAERHRSGRPLADVRDAQIAGITISLQRRDGRAATLATRNVADFFDLQVVNPWMS